MHFLFAPIALQSQQKSILYILKSDKLVLLAIGRVQRRLVGATAPTSAAMKWKNTVEIGDRD